MSTLRNHWAASPQLFPYSLSDRSCKASQLLIPQRLPIRESIVTGRLRISRNYGFKGLQTESPFVAAEEEDYPRPAEVPWSKELSNTVSLIGTVGAPVEIKQFPSGKVLAWSRIAVKKSSTETFWINLSFWDEMAHIAHKYIEKGNQIHCQGRLVSDIVESEDGKSQAYFKVIVQQLNFIERSSQMSPTNSSRRGRNLGGDRTISVEETWQAFFANPSEWWDNRKTKKNPNYPDFKQKDTGEALWVDGRSNPHWVKMQLAKLDEKMRPVREEDGGWSPFSSYSDY